MPQIQPLIHGLDIQLIIILSGSQCGSHAIRLLSLFIIPLCAPSLVSPRAVLSGSKAVGCKPQAAKFHLHVQYD